MSFHRRAVLSTVLFTTVVAMAASLILFLGSTAQAAARRPETVATKAKVPTPLAELIGSDAWVGDDFGWSVSISGSTAVVGAPYANSYTGAAYVFSDVAGTWTQEAELTAGDATSGAEFGRSVSISGTTIVVGAPEAYYGIGSAYVFTETAGTWTEQDELAGWNMGAMADVKFGYSVETTGTTVMVGADGYADQAGSVFVFTGSGANWTDQQQLTASDGGPSQMFGWSLSDSGSTLLVSAVKAHNDTGAVYVFADEAGTWTQEAELTASDGVAENYFGDKAAVEGSHIVVGAPGHDNEQGAAYVFTGSGSTWTQKAELTASDGGPDDCFGWAVGLVGNKVLVGAEQTNNDSGAAYVFKPVGSKWRQRTELTANDGGSNDEFGYSASVSGQTAVIGADGAEAGAGSAFLYKL
jgi:hypothetical protein